MLARMDKLAAMRTFVRIIDRGSLTAAANDLGTSLPTVVRTLAALERHLGVPLLRRTTRRIHLTDEGAAYLERCRLALSAVEEAEDVLISRRRDLRGKLTVTAPVEFGRRYVAPFLTGFLTRHRGLTADLLLLNRMVNMVEEGVDVAVRIARLKDSTLVAVPVGQVRRIVCASPRYLERHGTPQVPSDLKDHRCVRHTVLTPRSEWSFRVGQRDVMIPVDTVFASNDIGSVLDACMDGLGSGMFLSYMVGQHVRDGRLCYVLERFGAEPIPVQIVHVSSRLVSSNVRAFVDECAKELRSTDFD
jgi:DNA-binding transcriptional LysR family regulator